MLRCAPSVFFFFNDTATTEIYTLSLHDALPISSPASRSARATKKSTTADALIASARIASHGFVANSAAATLIARYARSEEHTSELQSRQYLVCRLLLEKKKNHQILIFHIFTPLT